MLLYTPEYIKKYIKLQAGNAFPAQELWYRQVDRHFWGFEKKHDKLTIVSGSFTNGILNFDINTIDTTPTNDIENILENLISEKILEEYECYAMLI